MDTSFNPKEELVRLIGPTPKHPWAALIPQILLWCFRRFCVQKLILFEGTLEESLCEEVLDIVHTYCPKGLETVSIEWFTPENIEQVASPLEDYMAFFTRFCRQLDATIRDNDYERQDTLSDFLDESMGGILSEWLDKRHACFLIFPMEAEDDDEFNEGQFSRLINSLLMYSYAKAPLVKPQAEPQIQPLAEPQIQPQIQPLAEPQVQPLAKPQPPPPPPPEPKPLPKPKPKPTPLSLSLSLSP